MSKEVVLARPHPFIRKPMTELLGKLGYTPVTDGSSSRPAGVVVSSSVTSDAGSFEDVLNMVSEKYAGVPLIVATLLKPELAETSLGRSLSEVFPGKKLGFPSSGTRGDILVVRPDDLKSVGAEKMIQSFLR